MRLAIKGHPTRGKEVIEILEMLGGKNPYNYKGNYEKYYLISQDNSIYLLDYLPKDVVAYTLEEFEELYPHKVGDKVIVRGYKEQGEDEITSMIITYDNEVKYKTKNHRDTHYFTADSFKSTAAIKEPKELIIGFTKDNNGDWILNTHKDYEIKEVGGKFKVVKKQPRYPKTYFECCVSLNICEIQTPVVDGYRAELLCNLQKLLICRDAYWKVAGNWKPDLLNSNESKFAVANWSDSIEKQDYSVVKNFILAFPTAEMRDEFYDNFNELIEQCKELL